VLKILYIYIYIYIYITITETIRLRWFGYIQRKEENRIPKRELYMSLEPRPRGRPRNRWQYEMREDGRIVGGEGW
jgi:hypothetical protein